MSKNYRLYTFINFYLSQIQQGIQTAHIVHELFMKYKDLVYRQYEVEQVNARVVLHEWAANHKTIIVLNGGEGRAIAEMLEVTKRFGEKMDLPFVDFHEDEGLGNIRTGFGIVLPEEIFDARYANEDGYGDNAIVRKFVFPKEGEASLESVEYLEGTEEFNFLQLLKQKRLA